MSSCRRDSLGLRRNFLCISDLTFSLIWSDGFHFDVYVTLLYDNHHNIGRWLRTQANVSIFSSKFSLDQSLSILLCRPDDVLGFFLRRKLMRNHLYYFQIITSAVQLDSRRFLYTRKEYFEVLLQRNILTINYSTVFSMEMIVARNGQINNIS